MSDCSIDADRRSFDVAFSDIVTLSNDDRSRQFLALEVGTGYDEVKGPFGML